MSGLIPAQNTSTTTSTSQTPAELQSLIPQVKAAGAGVSTDPFGKPFFAGATESERAGQAAQAGFLGGVAPDFGQNVAGFANRLLDPGALELGNAPGGQRILSSITQAGDDQFQRALNRLTANQTPGTFGGARAGIEQAQLLGESQRSTQDTLANARLGFHNAAADRALNAPSLLASSLALGTAPGRELEFLGGRERGLDQIEIDNQLAARNDERTAPFAGLSQIFQLLSGVPLGQESVAETSVDVNQLLELFKILVGGGATAAGIASGFKTGATV